MVRHNKMCLNAAQKINILSPRKWYEWWNYKQGNKQDEEDFKILCRLICPKTKLIGKCMTVKKQYFDEN